MGKNVWLGSSKTEQADILTPQQKSFLSSVLSSGGQGASQAYADILAGPNEQQLNDVFQKAYVDPAQQAFQRNIVPGIQQSFADMDAGSSSALNRALADAAGNLSTQLGSQYGSLYENALTRQLQGLSGLGGLAGQQTYQPLVHQKEGLLGSLISAGGKIAAAYAQSSEKVKEDIEAYYNDESILDEMDVYSYRYKGQQQQRLGFIAELMPDEVVVEMEDGIAGVDLYGVLALLTNAVKSLRSELSEMKSYVRSMECWLHNHTDYDQCYQDDYDSPFPEDEGEHEYENELFTDP